MDQAKALRKLKSDAYGAQAETVPRRVRVVAITSGKGGVGKTGIAANLAYILSSRNKKTLILDADTGLANIDVVLGLCPKYNLSHVLSGEIPISEAIIKTPGGFYILPASSGIQEMAELTRGQKLSLIDEISSWQQELDFMLIDTAAGISSNVMYFNMAASETIVVVTPEPTSLTDAYAVIKVLFQKHAKKRFLLIVNMTKSKAEAWEVYTRLNQATDHFLSLTIQYLGHVVDDDFFKKAIRQQKIIAEIYPKAPASQCLREIADKLEESTADYQSGSLNFF